MIPLPTPVTALLLESTLIPAGVNPNWTPVERNFDGVTMVLVPAGCFRMGSTEAEIEALVDPNYNAVEMWWYKHEMPAHEQCIHQSFWIDKLEVSQGQFSRFGFNAGREMRIHGDEYPITNVAWEEAQRYCEARGGRLPTEAEWEYAARGPQSLIYPWGNTFDETNVVYRDSLNPGIEMVGSRLRGASWVGVLDLSGNVDEWVHSIRKPYPYRADDGREQSTEGFPDWVMRGGGSYSDSIGVQAARRYVSQTTGGNSSTGIRCARDHDSLFLSKPTLTPTATPRPIVKSNWRPIEKAVKGITMVYIPPGCFFMGTSVSQARSIVAFARTQFSFPIEFDDETDVGDEQPLHKVCLTQGYWISKFEITNAQYRRFIDLNGYQQDAYWSEDGLLWRSDRTKPEYECNELLGQPQVCLTWYEMEAFAHWWGGRLPTEAEWEYAARGPESWVYPWGDAFEGERLNSCDLNCRSSNRNKYVDDGYSGVALVGSYENGESWFGVYDMSGNVEEWVADWYDPEYYQISPRNDPLGPFPSGWSPGRVIKGGAWVKGLIAARPASRTASPPEEAAHFRGFRVVMGSD